MPTVSILRRQLAAAATASKSTTPLLRTFATASAATPSALSSGHHKILIIGGGSAGISLASQLRATFASEGQQLADGDVAIVDGSREHHFQPGWTLVGAGLKDKESFAYSMDGVIPAGVAHIPNHASKFAPSSNKVTLDDGRELTYDHLVVAAGIKTRFDAVKGLEEALKDPLGSKVASIYSYETCDKTWDLIEALPKHSGSQKLSALFTQPFGPVKCAGAPQKINYMAWDRWRQTGRGDGVQTHFMTGMPTMFSVPHYSAALDALRKERGIEASFNTDLVEVRSEGPGKRVAIFKDLKSSNGARVEKEFDLLHVTPPMGPLDVIKNSELADAAGWVDVDQGTLQHKRFKNVFSAGDCSSLPTSKTAAAITAQAPVLVHNLHQLMTTGTLDSTTAATYDGYTSCPLFTGYGQLMLAEFTYGAQPAETFGKLVDQRVPRKAFYHLAKDVFPWAYEKYMLKGAWYGPRTLVAPQYLPKVQPS